MSIKLIFLFLAFTILISISNGKFFKDNKNLLKNANENLFKRQKRETTSLKSLIQSGWENNKSELLAGFVQELTDNETSITLVGWQDIHNEDGSLNEINAIELVIPPSDKPAEKSDDDDEDDDDEELVENTIAEIQSFLKPLYDLGVPTYGTAEEFDKTGKPTIFAYFDSNQIYSLYESGLALYNTTETTTTQHVDEFIDKIKSIYKEYGILAYDNNGGFIKNKSQVNPSAIASVVDEYEASNDILETAPTIFSNVYVEYPKDEVPKQLSLQMNKAFPSYHWRTIVDPTGYYISRDVSISLNYDSFEENPGDVQNTYMLYGIKN